MKPIKSLLVLAIMLVPGLAAAQGYYGGGGGGYYSQPQPGSQTPGGFHNRQGRLAWGFGIGIGGMHDAGSNITSCGNCDYNPAAIEFDAHVGGFLGPRFELMGEFQLNGQTVHSDAYNGDTVLSQNVLMIAAQYWLTPQLWLKGGIGFAHLQADDSYFQYELSDGAAIMGGVGYEVMSARNFSVDLQGRLIQGSYDGLNDRVTSATVGVGLNWY
jgi:hypothetical protein